MDKILKEQIAEEVVEQIYAAYPSLRERFGENGYDRTIEDNYHHLDHLETAFEMKDEQLFLDYTSWLQEILTSRNVGTDLIIDNFERLSLEIGKKMSGEHQIYFTNYLKSAIRLLQS